MRYILLGMGALLIAGVAVAQPAPPEGPPGPREEGMHGHHGMMRRMMEGGKAAHFRFVRGDNRVDIKCAADEPMKACVEAAGTLLDKLGPK